MNRRFVYTTILTGRVTAAQLVAGVAFDVATASIGPGGERKLNGINVHLKALRIDDEVMEKLKAYDDDADSPRVTSLPMQERYRRVTVDSNSHILPFSPPGSHSVLANP